MTRAGAAGGQEQLPEPNAGLFGAREPSPTAEGRGLQSRDPWTPQPCFLRLLGARCLPRGEGRRPQALSLALEGWEIRLQRPLQMQLEKPSRPAVCAAGLIDGGVGIGPT